MSVMPASETFLAVRNLSSLTLCSAVTGPRVDFGILPGQTLPGYCALRMLAAFEGPAHLFRPLDVSQTIASLVLPRPHGRNHSLSLLFPGSHKHSAPVLAASLLRSVAGDHGGRFKLDCVNAGLGNLEWRRSSSSVYIGMCIGTRVYRRVKVSP